MQETLLGFGAIFLLAMLRIPLAYAMGIVGFGGIGLLMSWPAANASAAQVVYETGFAYVLSTIPLFILSGSLIVFGLSASSFAIPGLLGGRRVKMVATLIYDEYLNELNWPLGAAMQLPAP